MFAAYTKPMGSVEPDKQGCASANLRAAVKVAVLGQDEFALGTLTDISDGGCFFSTSVELRVGLSVIVGFRTGSNEACSATGQVIADPVERGIAVRFDEINERMRVFLSSLSPVPAETRFSIHVQIADGHAHII